MLDSMSVALPLTLAAVFVASGIAKLRRPDDVQGWTELGVPASLRRAWLVRLHPWGELALGAALALLGGMLGLLAALVSVVLMAAYLWLVARARRQTPDASCSCFGERRRITVVTVVRNAWLTALAVAAAAVIWMTPLFGGAALIGLADLGWLAALAIAAVTVGVILWPEGGENATDTTPAVEPVTVASVEELDYVRTRTPAVPVTLADGSTINLRELAARRPLLLLAVSETCGSCTPVIDSTSKWRRLLPEVDVRFLVMLTPEVSQLTEVAEPQSLHDPHGYVRGSIADWSTPTAVLFGADGWLAGGPISGADAITEFVEDIRASLDEAAAAVTSP
ncbi:MAG: MauE/DoxX family redox-associated membrane protein [Microbacterium sp.]